MAGHRTSISLEGAFWKCLSEVADAKGITVPALLTKIDSQRGKGGLSSSVRVYLLKYYRKNNIEIPVDLKDEPDDAG